MIKICDKCYNKEHSEECAKLVKSTGSEQMRKSSQIQQLRYDLMSEYTEGCAAKTVGGRENHR